MAGETPKLRACARACCLPTVATLKSENRRKFAVKCRRENYQLLASLQYFSSLSEIKPLLCFTVDASISVMATLVHRSTRPVKVTYLKQISLFRRPTIRHEAEGYSRWSKNRLWKQKDDICVTESCGGSIQQTWHTHGDDLRANHWPEPASTHTPSLCLENRLYRVR